MSSIDKIFMNEAIACANEAIKTGDVPIGAVIVKDGKIISRGQNTREANKTSVGHAEIEAISDACKKLGSWHLDGCTLYVTLEPCPMCAGAIINSRIKRVVYAAKDAKAGAFGSVINLNSYPLNHKCEISQGICEQECSRLLSNFFKNLRK